MPVNRAYALAIVMMLCFPGYLFAQTYLQPEIISIENGLSSHHVNDITIDQEGYLWAGTSKGLNRFDGYEFKQFFAPQSLYPAQESYDITKVRTDRSGNIWFLSNAGVGMVEKKTGEITFYNRNSIVGFDAVLSKFIDITIDDEMTTWVLTDFALISIKPGMLMASYPLPENQTGNIIVPTCLAADRNTIWVGSNSGPNYFNRQSESFLSLGIENNQTLLSNPDVNCLFVDQENAVWFGTANGLNRYTPVDFDFDAYYPENSRNLLPGNEILNISHDEDGNLLLVTGAGIKIFDTKRLRFTQIGFTYENTVYAAISDSLGNIWCASSRGIIKIRKTDLIVINYNTSSSDLRLTANHVSALQTLPGYNLWVGYKSQEFNIINTRTSEVSHHKITTDDEVRGFYRYGTDRMMAVTNHDLIIVAQNGSEESRLVERYAFIQQDLLNKTQINCFFQDTSSRLWLGTSDGIQLLQLDRAQHVSMKKLKIENDSILLNQVYDIKRDTRGNLWLGTDNGLIFFNMNQQSAEKYIPYDKELLNTENKKVYTILAQSPTIYWIGTSRGIFSFNVNNREFMALNDPKLMNSSVHTLTFDRYGNLWIGTDIGLYYYDQSSTSILFFDPVEGLINYAYTTSVADAGGNVYVAGEHGLSKVDIVSVEPSLKYHDVVITGIYWIEDDLKKEIFYTVPDTIVLPIRRNAIQINFAVLDLSRPENNHFTYSFAKAGKESGLFQPVSQHHVILNPLSFGKYIFTLRGSNSNHVWNPKDTTLVIIIEAPFWRSLTVIVISVFVMVMFLFFVIWQWFRWVSSKNSQSKEKELIAKQIMEQKEELTQKNKSITDSINYAKRIQTAMLPPYKMLKAEFPSSFILYMPKDIVSGDFYWINKMDDKTFVAAVDCTGHGVPGAFMSIIGFELFRKITSIERLKRPSDILNRLNEDFHEIFKDVDNVVLRDGMDVAFCSIDKKNKILEFSGAFNPLYLIRDNKITEIKGDRFAIGLDEIDFMEQTFKNHLIPLQKGDIIYIFSDGFADQFGGPDGKKYKYRRFKHLLLNMHQLQMEKQREILENNVIEWRGIQEQVDDILIIGIHIDF